MGAVFDIDRISFAYGNRPIIKTLSARLESGIFYGILGPNGCGKTTFLDLLVNHQKPASGRILFRGTPLRDYSIKALAREMALVAQNFYVNFPFTVQEIVTMGRYPFTPRFSSLSEADGRQVERVMQQTGVDQFKDEFITELSGGERQRVVFTRALAQDTPILILDEATSNLDIRHAIQMLNIAAEGVHQKGKTVIAVFQDINLAATYCDRLLFMKKGRIAAQGKTEAILSENTLFDVFGIQSKVYFDTYANAKQVVFGR
jgi:iron complex transport system ATP-binding protein